MNNVSHVLDRCVFDGSNIYHHKLFTNYKKWKALFNQYSFSTSMPRTKPHGPKHSSTMSFQAEECDLHTGPSADLQKFAGFPVINLENIPKELMGLN